jgi:nucleoid DNA-binding protein
MTKRELAVKIAGKIDVNQSLVLKVIDELLKGIIDTLSRGEGIELRNFGVFKVRLRKERTGRNPRTGEKVPIPPRKVVHFKAGKILKAKVK